MRYDWHSQFGRTVIFMKQLITRNSITYGKCILEITILDVCSGDFNAIRYWSHACCGMHEEASQKRLKLSSVSYEYEKDSFREASCARLQRSNWSPRKWRYFRHVHHLGLIEPFAGRFFWVTNNRCESVEVERCVLPTVILLQMCGIRKIWAKIKPDASCKL